MARYIDFNYVKEHADVEAILAHYHLETNGSGDERRACCPFHDDENPSFSINVTDGKFHCHAASCGEKGNILDFVAAMEKTDDLREASEVISEICGIDLAAPKRGKSCRRGRRTTSQGEPKTKTAKRTKKDASEEQEKDETPEDADNTPLEFKLTLDPGHEYGEARNLSQSDIERFEMGYCKRGTMKGWWCVPYHNLDGDVVAYIGRNTKDPIPNEETKYKLPKGFHKQLELFNLHRVKGNSGHVTIVEGAFDAIRLHSLCMPAVALIGTAMSDQQIELLVQSGMKSVTVMLDNDAPDDKTRDAIQVSEQDMIYRLSRRLLVRSVELPEGDDPATVDEDFLRGKVPVFPN